MFASIEAFERAAFLPALRPGPNRVASSIFAGNVPDRPGTLGEHASGRAAVYRDRFPRDRRIATTSDMPPSGLRRGPCPVRLPDLTWAGTLDVWRKIHATFASILVRASAVWRTPADDATRISVTDAGEATKPDQLAGSLCIPDLPKPGDRPDKHSGGTVRVGEDSAPDRGKGGAWRYGPKPGCAGQEPMAFATLPSSPSPVIPIAGMMNCAELDCGLLPGSWAMRHGAG